MGFNALSSVETHERTVFSAEPSDDSLVHWNTEMEALRSKTLLLKVQMFCEWIMLHMMCVHKTEHDFCKARSCSMNVFIFTLTYKNRLLLPEV